MIGILACKPGRGCAIVQNDLACRNELLYQVRELLTRVSRQPQQITQEHPLSLRGSGDTQTAATPV